MPWSPLVLNLALDAIADEIDAVSLHAADPGTTGASELTGGVPAYARQIPDWDPATGGVLAIGTPLTFDVPAGPTYTVTHAGLWAGSTFVRGVAMTGASADRTFSTQATLVIDELEVTGS